MIQKKNKEPEKKWRRTVAARRKSADENKEEPSFFLLLFSREREREREKERNERKTEKKKNVSPRGPRNETNQPHLYGSFRASRAGFFHKLNRTLTSLICWEEGVFVCMILRNNNITQFKFGILSLSHELSYVRFLRLVGRSEIINKRTGSHTSVLLS